MRRGSLTIIAASVVALSFPAASHAGQCRALINEPERGAAAIRELGDDLDRAADRNDVSERKLKQLLREDNTAWVDRCGGLFIREPKPPKPAKSKAAQAGPQVQKVSTASTSDVFSLHSRPGANKIIYLNFQGEASHTDTRWSSTPFSVPAFSTDTDPETFNDDELMRIINTWKSVAEDFSPFEVDVTTEKPPDTDLVRSSAGDQNYGTKVSFTSRFPWGECKCGGMATLGTFDEVNQPAATAAFVITNGSGLDPVNLGFVASHEAGHTFGLRHWGNQIPGQTYAYAIGKHPNWGPIMGAPYYKTLTQWSRGEYLASWTGGGSQDDLAMIESNGTPRVSDDFPDTLSSAQPLGASSFSQEGMISSREDTDWFSFTSAGGVTRLVSAPSWTNSNLDIGMSLYDSAGALVESANPLLSGNFPNGTEAIIERELPAGTYYVRIDGTGQWNISDPARYSDYGSLGAYYLTRDGQLPRVNSVSLPDATLETPYQHPIEVTEGDLPTARVSLVGRVPNLGVQATSTGYVIVGRPMVAGLQTIALRATDIAGQQGPVQVLTIFVNDIPGPQIDPVSLPNGLVSAKYRVALTADTVDPRNHWAIGNLPPGLKMAPREYDAVGPAIIEGTPTTAGTYLVSLFVSSASGKTATAKYPLVIEPNRPPAISTESLPEAVVGRNYPTKISITRGAFPATLKLVSGYPPAGLSLRATGMIGGKPQLEGSNTFTVVAIDSKNQRSAPRTFTISVVEVEPTLKTGAVKIQRGGVILVTFTCSSRLGCSPGRRTVYLSKHATTESVRVAWPDIGYGRSSSFRVAVPASLYPDAGSMVNVSDAP